MFNLLRTRIAGRGARTEITRHLSLVALATAAIGLVGCSAERLAGPSMEASPSNVITSSTATLTTTAASTLTKVTGLRWSTAVTESSTSKVIGAGGGSITAAGGLTLTVPKGAVSTNTTFVVRRVAGNLVAYEFEPHGKTFAKPLGITQLTAGTNFRTYPLSVLVRGAYFTDRTLLDQILGIAFVSEFRSATISLDRSNVRFTVDHFSGYMVSMD